MYNYKPVEAPLCTLYINSYNHELYVREALESLRNQTFQSFELIIVDDFSTDKTVEVIQQWINEFSVQCVFIKHEKNKGVVNTLNEIIDLARGKYCIGLDSDDIALSNRAEKLISTFESLPEEYGMVAANWQNVDRTGKHLNFGLPSDFIFPENPYLYLLNPKLILFHINASAIRTVCYKNVGYYSSDYLQDDYYMMLRVAKNYKVKYVSEVVMKYRQLQHSFGKSAANRPVMAYDFFRLLNSLDVKSKAEKKAVAKQYLGLLEEFHTLNYYDRKNDISLRKKQLEEMLIQSRSSLKGNIFYEWLRYCEKNNVNFKKWLFVRNKLKRIQEIF